MSSTNCGCPNTSYPEPVSTVNVKQTILQFGENYGVWRQETLDAAVGLTANLSGAPLTAQSINLYVNGVLQQQGVDYVPAPESVTFLEPVPPGAVVTASYLTLSSGAVTDVPIGTIIAFAGSLLPPGAGFLVCDGAIYDGTDPQYQLLFGVIGQTYGGTGTNFAVPDLQLPFYQGTQLLYGPAFIKYQ